MQHFGAAQDRFLGGTIGCAAMNPNLDANGAAGKRTIYWEKQGRDCVLSKWAGRWGIWMPNSYVNCVKEASS